jgi:hypothetical protein
VALANLPALHFPHAVVPFAPVKVPKGHPWQVPVPATEVYVPGRHLRHTVAPSNEYSPAPHAPHTVLPSMSLYVPGRHAAHDASPLVAPYQPIEQFTHAPASDVPSVMLPYLPAPHVSHPVAPVTTLYLPTEHPSHRKSPLDASVTTAW